VFTTVHYSRPACSLFTTKPVHYSRKLEPICENWIFTCFGYCMQAWLNLFMTYSIGILYAGSVPQQWRFKFRSTLPILDQPIHHLRPTCSLFTTSLLIIHDRPVPYSLPACSLFTTSLFTFYDQRVHHSRPAACSQFTTSQLTIYDQLIQHSRPACSLFTTSLFTIHDQPIACSQLLIVSRCVIAHECSFSITFGELLWQQMNSKYILSRL